MFGKRPSEGNDDGDFFRKFNFIDYPDGMEDFGDK